MTARIIPFGIPEPEDLGIPGEVTDIAGLSEGLVLICGPAESGKSTTLACLVNRINRTRTCHILTVERPIEYLFRNDRSFISQREVPLDSDSVLNCLRAARWQSPDVIMLSETEDPEDISELLKLADSHRLVFSAFQAKSMPEAVRRIIESFPADRRTEAAERLGHSLKYVVCQEIVPSSGGTVPVFDIIPADENIARLVSGADFDQLREYIRNRAGGSVSMNDALEKMFMQGMITEDNAVYYSSDPEDMRTRIEKTEL